MITARSTRLVVAAAGAAMIVGGAVGPATADVARETAATPLVDYEEQPGPCPGAFAWDDYSYETTYKYWSVVAIELYGSQDNFGTLYLYDQNQEIVETNDFVGHPKFIAVDSNRRPLGSYFASVSCADTAYIIELAQGGDVLVDESESIAVAFGDVAFVRDTFLHAGSTYTFSVTPSQKVDPDLYLMSSNPRQPDTWVRNHHHAAMWAPAHGIGVVESFSFTPILSQWYGVVVTTAGLAGSISLKRVTS